MRVADLARSAQSGQYRVGVRVGKMIYTISTAGQLESVTLDPVTDWIYVTRNPGDKPGRVAVNQSTGTLCTSPAPAPTPVGHRRGHENAQLEASTLTKLAHAAVSDRYAPPRWRAASDGRPDNAA